MTTQDFEAALHHGDARMIDHNFTADAAAGEVLVLNDKCYIVHGPVLAGERQAIAAGGAVYRVKKVQAENWTTGVEIFWDDAANLATTVATGNTFLGLAVLEDSTNSSGYGTNNSDFGIVHHLASQTASI